MSLNSDMRSLAAWSMSCRARSSFGFENACSSEKLYRVYEMSRFDCPGHIPMKCVSVDTTEQETARQEGIWKLKVADMGIL